MQGKFLIHNNNFIAKENFKIETENRAFQYGDSVFETMFASCDIIHFFEDHISRILKAAEAVKIKVPQMLLQNSDEFYQNILRVLRKNKFFGGTRIRLTIYRKEGGYYSPTSKESEFIVETSKLENTVYELNKVGLRLCVFNDLKKNINIFSPYKTGNALLNVLAGIYVNENNFDDCILFNQQDFICETISSNLFYVQEKVIFTPALSEGCVVGIMRKAVIEIAKKMNYQINEVTSVQLSDLLNADELFLTNSITGIRWVIALNDRRYFNFLSQIFIKKLNELITN